MADEIEVPCVAISTGGQVPIGTILVRHLDFGPATFHAPAAGTYTRLTFIVGGCEQACEFGPYEVRKRCGTLTVVTPSAGTVRR